MSSPQMQRECTHVTYQMRATYNKFSMLEYTRPALMKTQVSNSTDNSNLLILLECIRSITLFLPRWSSSGDPGGVPSAHCPFLSPAFLHPQLHLLPLPSHHGHMDQQWRDTHQQQSILNQQGVEECSLHNLQQPADCAGKSGGGVLLCCCQ